MAHQALGKTDVPFLDADGAMMEVIALLRAAGVENNQLGVTYY